MKIQDIEVTKIERASDELSDTFFRVCTFCNKVVRITPTNLKSCINIGGENFYCPFCLRNNFHHRSSKNVLMMSYRGIIGYYYHRLYCVEQPSMYLSELEDMIETHVKIGLQNPVLTYDPDTFLWFVDFNRIGVAKRKAPFDEVLQVADDMFESFYVTSYTDDETAHDEMWERFSKALTTFYKNRKRPKKKKMLIPTFSGCIHGEQEKFLDSTRDFTKISLRVK